MNDKQVTIRTAVAIGFILIALQAATGFNVFGDSLHTAPSGFTYTP